MLRRLALSLAIAAGIALPVANSAQAGIGDGALAARAHLSEVAPLEKADFIYGGYNYCWYPTGWKGAGFYRCGYAWHVGLGWGGGYGWNGWGGGYAAGWRGHGWRGGIHHRPVVGHHRPGGGGHHRPGGGGHHRPGGGGHHRPGGGGHHRPGGGGHRRR